MGSSVLLRVLSSAMCVLALLHVVQSQCADYKSETMSTCSMLFETFQAALVDSKVNLYNLRKTFSPASHPAPILVNVSYEISFDHVPNDLCPGADNDSTLFNTSGIRYLNYGWTSSVLYTYYHPAELNRLQPQIVFQFLAILEFEPESDGRSVATAFTWDGTKSITTAQLSLFIPSLPCSPSYEEVYHTLWDITSLLKIYTEVRANLTTWDIEDSGYVINGSAFSTYAGNWSYNNTPFYALFIFSYVISLFLAVLSTVVIIYVIYSKTKNSETADSEFKLWHSLFWTIIGILTQFNFILVIVDLIYAIIWCASPTGCGGAGFIKFSWIAITVSYSFLGALTLLNNVSVINKCLDFDSVPFLRAEVQKASLFCPPFSSLLCFIPRFSSGLSKCTTYFLKILLVSTLFISTSIVFFYFLPVLVLLIVYPIKIAAAYSFLIATIVFYILIAFYGEYKRVLLPKYTFQNGLYFSGLSFLNICFIIIIIVFYVSVYNVISSGLSQNPVLQAILSFLPSLILSSLIWVFRNRLLKWLEKNRETEGRLPELDGTTREENVSQEDRQQEHREPEPPETDSAL